jgi:hypothetical protein
VVRVSLLTTELPPPQCLLALVMLVLTTPSRRGLLSQQV